MPVLIGGRRKIRAEIKLGKQLGAAGQEGKVLEAEVVLKGGKRSRTVRLAQKVFHEWEMPNAFAKYSWRNPERQFAVMKKLSRLNRQKKAGLRIVPTIRILKGGKMPSLLTTRLETLQIKEVFHSPFWNDFKADAERQEKIAAGLGFTCSDDAFFPVKDRKTGKVVAVLADFGQVEKIGALRRLQKSNGKQLQIRP